MINTTNKAIEKAKNDKIKLAKQYNTHINNIVWMGGNRYIIVIQGREIRTNI